MDELTMDQWFTQFKSAFQENNHVALKKSILSAVGFQLYFSFLLILIYEVYNVGACLQNGSIRGRS